MTFKLVLGITDFIPKLSRKIDRKSNKIYVYKMSRKIYTHKIVREKIYISNGAKLFE